MTQYICTACQGADRQFIGGKDDVVDVYAFRGGATIDSVFQLGVAHAHVVSNLPLPKLIVGLSTGAVHAAATAEILQAFAELERGGDGKREAALHRFREILYAYQDFATDLQGTAMPDAFEADAGRSLQPNPQAIHFGAERESREEALRARSGLIALINDLFAQTITIRTLTRVTRAVAGLIATAELPKGRRGRARTREMWYLTKAVFASPGECLHLLSDLMRAWLGGTAKLAREALKTVQPGFPTLFDWALKLMEGRHPRGYTAGQIVFSSGRPRIALNAFLLGTLSLTFAALATYGLVRSAHILHPMWFTILVAVIAAVGTLLFLDSGELRRQLQSATVFDRVLAYYDLQRDLGSDYLIEDLFIRIFDPTYHGTLVMADVIDRATRDAERERRTDEGEPERRTFNDYATGEPPIRVVPFVADLETGQLSKVAGSVPVVDGLKAAVSRVPFLHPVELETGDDKDAKVRFYVDAASISHDAAISALDILRQDLHPEARKVRMFSVSPITPVQTPPPQARGVVGTVEVALGALELSRFRDFGDERDNIDAYNDLIPDDTRHPERLVTGSETPVALRCFGTKDGKPIHFVKSEFMEIAPATALHTTGRLLREREKDKRQDVIAEAVAEGCRATLAARYGRDDFDCRSILGRWTETPGAAEVCRHCTQPRKARPAPQTRIEVVDAPAPSALPAKALNQEPTINLLFSGGVFRGVFQIGVLNALSQLEIKPNVIAGSSVGSIVAAMVARVFTHDKVAERNLEVGRLAATFLTLDRLIITDRFADFVRRFTLRAAAARFSLRDTDLFFRNYDRVAGTFDSVARRVVAGIEHLFYVSPFELADLVREVRDQNYSRAYDLACRYAQEICDRGTVGFELLGAEPLALLIKQHVLTAGQRERRAHGVPMGSIGKDFVFLLTATNLTTRALQIIGGKEHEQRTALLEALLASSAFPGVFRPRWAREIFFGNNSLDQYVDGGVLDNLPLRAVVDHMYRAASNMEIEFRPTPRRPHLVLTASLEPEIAPLAGKGSERIGRSWLAARERVQRLRYNQKVDRFRKAQRDLRYLFNRYAEVRGNPVGVDTLDIEVVIVKPKWLCGTFAFHPMLGFRSQRQAGSIAHGCAATFQTIARILEPDPGQEALSDRLWPAHAWKMKTDGIHLKAAKDLNPINSKNHFRDGICHFRKEALCPFSRNELNKDSTLTENVKQEIEVIYKLCGIRSTHEQPPNWDRVPSPMD